MSVQVGKIRPFAEALVGAASQNLRLKSVSSVGGSTLTIEDSEDDTRLATAFGGGVDYRIARILALRVEADYLGTRLFKGLQLATTTPVQHNVRFSTGIVFRF